MKSIFLWGLFFSSSISIFWYGVSSNPTPLMWIGYRLSIFFILSVAVDIPEPWLRTLSLVIDSNALLPVSRDTFGVYFDVFESVSSLFLVVWFPLFIVFPKCGSFAFAMICLRLTYLSSSSTNCFGLSPWKRFSSTTAVWIEEESKSSLPMELIRILFFIYSV